MATAPAPPAAIDLTAVTETYVKIRTARSELKREFEARDDELKAKLGMLENAMLGHLHAHEMESVRTTAGTFYRQIDVKPNITDDKLFYDWIVANDAVGDALERRVKVGFVKEFMDAHDGLPPPGVSVSREYVCRVRKGA